MYNGKLNFYMTHKYLDQDDEILRKIDSGYRLQSPKLMEDIEDGDVWYKKVMLECWKAQPDERPHIRDIRKSLETLFSSHYDVRSDDEESSVASSQVAKLCISENNMSYSATNDYIQLIEPSQARDSPDATNPGYQDTTMSDRGCYKWLDTTIDRKSTRLNSSHSQQSRMPSSA